MSTELTVAQPQAVSLEREALGYQALLDVFMRAGELGKGLLKNVATPLDALALADAGAAFGMTPLTALRSFHMVEGKPVLAADKMVGLCLAHPACMAFVCEVSTADRCVYVGRRRQRDGSISEMRIEWTMKRAQQAGVAGKAVWKQYPDQMLRARASSELARALFPDAMAGIYTAEELGGEEPRRITDVRMASEVRPAQAEQVVDAEVEETRYVATEKGRAVAAGAHPRIEYLLGDDLSLETLCWYLAARDKPIEAPTLEAANAWASSVADSAWAKHGPAMREAITRRLGIIEAAGGPADLLSRARVGSPMWVKAETAADRLGLAKDVSEWPARALVGIALAVAEEKTEAPQPKKGPGAKAIATAIADVPGGWDAVEAGFRRAGVEAPRPETMTDAQQGELAYSIVKWCQASASAEDTTALVCEALSDAP